MVDADGEAMFQKQQNFVRDVLRSIDCVSKEAVRIGYVSSNTSQVFRLVGFPSSEHAIAAVGELTDVVQRTVNVARYSSSFQKQLYNVGSPSRVF